MVCFTIHIFSPKLIRLVRSKAQPSLYNLCLFFQAGSSPAVPAKLDLADPQPSDLAGKCNRHT